MKYLLINWEDKTVWQTDDLEDINQGYSVKAVDTDDLINEVDDIIEEERDRWRAIDRRAKEEQ